MGRNGVKAGEGWGREELRNHVLGTLILFPEEIAEHKATIDLEASLFGTRSSVFTAAFEFVSAYDTTIGPLWLPGSFIQEFDRNTVSDEDIHWVVYTVMQTILHRTYTGANFAAHGALLDGFLFGSSADFPGQVDPLLATTHTVMLDASYPDTYGWDRQGDEFPARKPTGTYLAPAPRRLGGCLGAVLDR